MFFNRASLHVVRSFLDSHHYIGSRCADPTRVYVWRHPGGLWGEDGEIAAVAVFAPPVSKAWGKALELTRLARDETCIKPLTMFIALCIRHLRVDGGFDLLISYADPAVGHHGGIYQASNWLYLGPSSKKAVYIHPQTGRRLSMRSYDQSTVKYSGEYIKVATDSKLTYAYPLNKKTRKAFHKRAQPYPKPNQSHSLTTG